MRSRHAERHRTAHIGWLRAAVLVPTTASCRRRASCSGVAAARAGTAQRCWSPGAAGLVAGAMSMAAGRVRVGAARRPTRSRPTSAEERARAGGRRGVGSRAAELAGSTCSRGLEPELAKEVAAAADGARRAGEPRSRRAPASTEMLRARPLQAALASAASFAVGAAAPLVTVALSSDATLLPAVARHRRSGCWATLGWLAAQVGGAQRVDRRGPRGVLGRARDGGDDRGRRGLRARCERAPVAGGRVPSRGRRVLSSAPGRTHGRSRAGPSTWRTCCDGTTSTSSPPSRDYIVSQVLEHLWADPACTVVTRRAKRTRSASCPAPGSAASVARSSCRTSGLGNCINTLGSLERRLPASRPCW